MRQQWRSLAALHASAPSSCFPLPHPPREEEEEEVQQQRKEDDEMQQKEEEAVRVVGCDGRVRAYRSPVTARDLTQEHPRHLVCRADALLVGERIPAVAPGEELRPGQAYFLLPADMFRSVLSFVSLASSLLLLLSSSTAAGNKYKKRRPFELCRTASGTLQIKFSDDFLAEDKEEEDEKKTRPAAKVLRGDERLEKEYEGLVGYAKSRRWAPKLEPIEEVAVAAATTTTTSTEEEERASSSAASPAARRKSRGGIPFLGRLGSRRRRDSRSSAAMSCSAVACSG